MTNNNNHRTEVTKALPDNAMQIMSHSKKSQEFKGRRISSAPEFKHADQMCNALPMFGEDSARPAAFGTAGMP